MAKTCGHLDCSFENRLEYCEIDATDPEGAASVVVDMLDALLYDSGPITSDEYTINY